MLEKTFLQPDSMWKPVGGGHHLYSAIAVARGSDHAHIYLAGQVARDPATGEVVGSGTTISRRRLPRVLLSRSAVWAIPTAWSKSKWRRLSSPSDLQCRSRVSSFVAHRVPRPSVLNLRSIIHEEHRD
jgi:hypothetical protein